MKKLIVASLLAALAHPAAAADANALFKQMKFTQAAAAARAENTSDGYVLAAKAVLTDAAYMTTDKAKAKMKLAAALVDLDKALKLDPRNSDARLWKATALGFRSKIDRSRSDAKTAKRMIDEVIKAEPRNPLAWRALGVWHGEAVSNLEPFLAGTMLGAKSNESLKAFQRSVELDPNDEITRTLYAQNLVSMKFYDEKDRIRALVTPVARGSGGDGLTQVMRRTARGLLEALNAGDRGMLKDRADDARPFDAVS